MTLRSSRVGALPSAGSDLVLDPQAAVQVEAELGLEVCGPRRSSATAGMGNGHEAHHQGEQADDDDQDRAGATHRGGMIQGTAVPRAAVRPAPAVSLPAAVRSATPVGRLDRRPSAARGSASTGTR